MIGGQNIVLMTQFLISHYGQLNSSLMLLICPLGLLPNTKTVCTVFNHNKPDTIAASDFPAFNICQSNIQFVYHFKYTALL